ncbi:MAG TPA: hypothetical protein PL163_24395, partial [Leptospiraceae bacterium]|nr:hypothetical protein [Leptospiraceae bacterium]
MGGLLTLGIIPIDHYEKASSTFYIFDKNLNLLDKKSIGESVRVFSGWFVPSNAGIESDKNPPPIAFKPHIQEYYDYLV